MFAAKERASGSDRTRGQHARSVMGVQPAERDARRFHDAIEPGLVASRRSEASRFGYRASSGEMLGGPSEATAWVDSTGKDGGAPDAGPMSKDGGSGPRLRKTDGTVTSGNNGAFRWPATWSIENATTTTEGWIVQRVDVTQAVTNASGTAITPGTGGFGGLRTSWYPLWEAWQVRGGAVFVGRTTTPHSADTYGQGEVGASTRGTTSIVGSADFYPNLTLPAAFVETNTAPTWALPATNTDPSLTGGTGVVAHNLTATWDGVGGTGATTVTTV